MFTGLIREIGTLRQRRPGRELVQLDIAAPDTAPALGEGDSLAVNGVCLTVTAVKGQLVTVAAAAETLRVSTAGRWRSGQKLHLEPALRVGQALDGHLVLGHVDGVGTVAGRRLAGGSVFLTVQCGRRLAAWLLPKGSVAVDGVSLTVDEGPHTDCFTVNLVPLTRSWTLLDRLRTGGEVNLEMDVLVKAARTGRSPDMLRAFAGTDTSAVADDKRVPSLASILDRGFGRKGKS